MFFCLSAGRKLAAVAVESFGKVIKFWILFLKFSVRILA
jgi:hypothetical protein